MMSKTLQDKKNPPNILLQESFIISASRQNLIKQRQFLQQLPKV
jgi:hypothetical protein